MWHVLLDANVFSHRVRTDRRTGTGVERELAMRMPVSRFIDWGLQLRLFLYRYFYCAFIVKMPAPFYTVWPYIEACTSQSSRRNMRHQLRLRALRWRWRKLFASKMRKAAVHSFMLRLPSFGRLVQHRYGVLCYYHSIWRTGFPSASLRLTTFQAFSPFFGRSV